MSDIIRDPAATFGEFIKLVEYVFEYTEGEVFEERLNLEKSRIKSIRL